MEGKKYVSGVAIRRAAPAGTGVMWCCIHRATQAITI